MRGTKRRKGEVSQIFLGETLCRLEFEEMAIGEHIAFLSAVGCVITKDSPSHLKIASSTKMYCVAAFLLLELN